MYRFFRLAAPVESKRRLKSSRVTSAECRTPRFRNVRVPNNTSITWSEVALLLGCDFVSTRISPIKSSPGPLTLSTNGWMLYILCDSQQKQKRDHDESADFLGVSSELPRLHITRAFHTLREPSINEIPDNVVSNRHIHYTSNKQNNSDLHAVKAIGK